MAKKAAAAAGAAATKPKGNKAPSESRTLPWTESMTLILLKLVQVTGTHIVTGDKVAIKILEKDKIKD